MNKQKEIDDPSEIVRKLVLENEELTRVNCAAAFMVSEKSAEIEKRVLNEAINLLTQTPCVINDGTHTKHILIATLREKEQEITG